MGRLKSKYVWGGQYDLHIKTPGLLFDSVEHLVDFNNIQGYDIAGKANSSYVKKSRFVDMPILHNTSAIGILILYIPIY